MSLLLRTAILCFFLLFALPVSGDSKVTPHNYFGGNYRAQLLEDVEQYHLDKGKRQLLSGGHRLEYAWDNFEFILAHFPNHPQALRHLYQTAKKMGSPHKAEPFFRRALRLYPDEPASHTLYGIFNYEQGEPEKAAEQFRTALELEPGSAEIEYNLGLALFASGQYTEAERLATQAYEAGFPLPGLKKKLKRVGHWKAK